MTSLRISDVVHQSGFEHRANVLSDGNVVYRLIDGSGSVKLPKDNWNAIGDGFSREIAYFRKRATKMLWLLFPATFAIALTAGQFFQWTGILILLGIYGGPLAIYFWYSAKVAKAAKSAEAQLKAFPKTESVTAPAGKIPRAIRIASFLLVGPYLLIAIIGAIGGPQTFRKTPFTGAHVGWLEMVAIGLIAFQLTWPLLAPKLSRTLTRSSASTAESNPDKPDFLPDGHLPQASR
jgi:hypothetical protein